MNAGPDVGAYRGLQVEWSASTDTTADISGMTAAGTVYVTGIAVEVKAVVVAPPPEGFTATPLTTASDATDLTAYTTASITPSANALVLAWVVNRRFSGGAGTVTLAGNGLTWVVGGESALWRRPVPPDALSRDGAGALSGSRDDHAQWGRPLRL